MEGACGRFTEQGEEGQLFSAVLSAHHTVTTPLTSGAQVATLACTQGHAGGSGFATLLGGLGSESAFPPVRRAPWGTPCVRLVGGLVGPGGWTADASAPTCVPSAIYPP